MPPRKPRTIHPLFANVARAKVMDKSGYYEYHNSPSPSATATTVMVDDDNPQGSAIDSAESSSMIGGTKRINYFGLDEESSDEEVDEERRQSIINGKRKADEQLEPLPNPNQRAFIQLPQPTLLERQDRNLDISVKIGLREQGAVTRASAIDPEFESPQNNKSLESKTKVEFREAQAMVRAQGVRVDTLRDSSKKSYERYIRHWKSWCFRKGYGDDYRVRYAKFHVYMEENLADEPSFAENPEDCILPIRCKSVKKKPSPPCYETGDRAQDVNEYRSNLNGKAASFELIDMHIKACVDLWEQQMVDPALDMSNERHPRSKAIWTRMDIYRRKMNIEKVPHKRRVVLDRGDELEEIKEVMKAAWMKSKGQIRIGLRDRLDAAWSHFLMARGESLRYATLGNIEAHTFRQKDPAGQYCLGVILTMLQGKTNDGSHEMYGVAVRNIDVELCPVGALGFYFLDQFEFQGGPPDFNTLGEDWTKLHLIHGGDSTKKFSQSGHHQPSFKAQSGAGVAIPNKVTHRYRGSGARHAQEAGADVRSISQHGGWSTERVITHYLSRISPNVALRMAGFTNHDEPFWLPRNTFLPPAELQREIFPFIESSFGGHPDWKAIVENVMMDRNRGYGRRPESRFNPSKSELILSRFLLLLAHLRKVILQDAVALSQTQNDPASNYMMHRIFGLPLFRSSLYSDFKSRLMERMITESSPTSDSLRTNAPAIHSEFRAMKNKLNDIDRKLGTGLVGDFEGMMERQQTLWTHAIGKAFLESTNMTVRELERVGSSIKMSITQSRQLFFETLSRVAQEAGRKEYIKVQQEKRQLKAKIQQPALQGILGRLSREVPSSSSSGIDNLSPPRDPEDYQQGSESESGESDSGQESEPVEPVEPVVINETVIAVDDHSHDDQDLCDQFNEALGTDALDQNWEDQEGQEDQEAGQNAEGQRRWDNEKELEKELGMRLCPYVPEFHYMEMEPRDRPIRDLWKEWFYGNEEKPSICRMEIEHGSRWRPGNAKAAVYLFKKRLINSVLREMTNAEPNLTVEQRIFYALDSVHLKISQAGSINKYEKSLPKGAPKRRRAPVQEPDQQGQLDQQDQLEQQDQLGQQDA